ncbi:MAG: hypothetical protein GEV00_10925 [Actinophytocola sp.]|nr:hypothetical protein [Actinophytocola sp.]
MSSTETLAAAAAPARLWRVAGGEDGSPDIVEQEDGVDADWAEHDLGLVDPYGQEFRPHLFGM